LKTPICAVKFVLTGLALAISAPSFAQDYPNHPVTVITPFPPGGAADVVLRLLTRQLTDSFKSSFIVENRAGAGGAIGTAYVARAAPDGYTLLLASSSAMSINPHLAVKNSYDPFSSFTPIVLIGSETNELVVTPSLPYKTVGDVIAAAKANPGKLNYGSNGIGTLSHLMGEMFKQQAGIQMLHVPYKGAAPVVTETAAGRVSVLFAAIASVLPMVQGGKLRALAVTSSKRSSFAPELPTIAESGLPGFEADQWWGLYAPAGLPEPIVTKLNTAVNRILQNPEARKLFRQEGIELSGGTPADLSAYLRTDFDRWGKVIKAGDVKPE
jgi:tripartite-type tricarboxylate transporter receptor subunit TctC